MRDNKEWMIQLVTVSDSKHHRHTALTPMPMDIVWLLALNHVCSGALDYKHDYN